MVPSHTIRIAYIVRTVLECAFFALLLSACETDQVKQRLLQLSAQLDNSRMQDTSVWESYSVLRDTVLEHNCGECDSIYNHAVHRISDTLVVVNYGPSLFKRSPFEYSFRDRDFMGGIQYAHELRMTGSFNAARSLYLRLLGNSPDLPDVAGNCSMEYQRVGLTHSAYSALLQADSVFAVRGDVRGRVWTQRLLYDNYMLRGMRQYALKSLRLFHDCRMESLAKWNHEDSITDINLIRSILNQDSGIHESDGRLAFGRDWYSCLSLYHQYRNNQRIPGLDQIFDTRLIRSTRVPRPVYRSAPFHHLRVWTDSLSAYNGRLGLSTRFGRYVSAGDRWTLVHDKSDSNSMVLQPASVIMLDTLLSSMDSIHGVFPIGGDTLLIISRRKIIEYTSHAVKQFRLSIGTNVSPDAISVVSVSPQHLLISSVSGVHLIDRIHFKTISSIEFKRNLERSVSIPIYTQWQSFIIPLFQNYFLVKQPTNLRHWGVRYDPIRCRIDFCNILSGSDTLSVSTHPTLLQYYLQWGGRIMACQDKNPDRFRLWEQGVSTNVFIEGQYEIQRTLKIVNSPPRFAALRTFDKLDVIDHSTNTVYPQFSALIPSDARGTNDVGVFISASGKLRGFYTDGHVLIGYDLSQVGFPLAPDVRISVPDDSIQSSTLNDNTVLESGKTYRIYATSNMVTSGHQVLGNLNSCDSTTWSIQGNQFPWQIEITPNETDSVLYVFVPSLNRIFRIEVYVPLLKRTWFVNTTVGLLALLISGIVFVSYSQYRRRKRNTIERAKSQQLELIREDMHDMIGSRLVRIASLARQAKPEEADAALARIHDMTLVTVRSLRNLLSLMSESTMTDAEFFGALREYVVESCSDAALKATVTVSTAYNERTTLDGSSRHELMMIVSEMLANTLRHAQATTVTFSIVSSDDAITLTWQDDGVGIAPSSQRGNGLNNIQRRASRLSANVDLISHPGGGTRYLITVPLQVS